MIVIQGTSKLKHKKELKVIKLTKYFIRYDIQYYEEAEFAKAIIVLPWITGEPFAMASLLHPKWTILLLEQSGDNG